MTAQSVFEKRLRPETTFDRIEGMLEQMNVPPKAIEWIRRNRKITTISVITIIAAVIIFSLYTSYKEKKIEQAASALSTAASIGIEAEKKEEIEAKRKERITALQEVAKEYSATTSGLWAEITLARNLMQAGKYKEAAEIYAKMEDKTDKENPLYALLIYGQANGYEAAKLYKEAVAAYKKLEEISGYQAIGYSGEGRILEVQGESDKAVAVYNNFILTAAEAPRLMQEKQVFEERVRRLQAVNE